MMVKNPIIEIPLYDMEKIFPNVDLQGRRTHKLQLAFVGNDSF